MIFRIIDVSVFVPLGLLLIGILNLQTDFEPILYTALTMNFLISIAFLFIGFSKRINGMLIWLVLFIAVLPISNIFFGT